MNKQQAAVTGAVIVVMLAVVAVGIGMHLPGYYWLPVLLMVMVFGMGAIRRAGEGPDRRSDD